MPDRDTTTLRSTPEVERENKRLRKALAEITRQPKGHECRGYCRWMYRIACAALRGEA